MTLLSLNSLNLSLPGRDNRGRSSEPMMRAPIRGVPQNFKEGSGSQRFQGWWFRVGSSVLGVGRLRSFFFARELSPLHCRPRDDEAAEKGEWGLEKD